MKTRSFSQVSLVVLLATLPCTCALSQGEQTHPSEREMAEKRQMLRERNQEIDQLRAKLAELKEAGKLDEAAEVKRHLANLQRDREGELRLDRDRAIQRENRKAEIAELRRLGHHEEAERLQEQLRQGEFRGGPPNLEPRPDREEPIPAPVRLHHLRVAIEHLHLAGMHEPAERLRHEAEQLEKTLHAERPFPEPMPPRLRERPEPRFEELQAGLHELRAQIEELHRAMRNLQGRLERQPHQDR